MKVPSAAGSSYRFRQGHLQNGTLRLTYAKYMNRIRLFLQERRIFFVLCLGKRDVRLYIE